ncbi:MAG: hypothetical protein SGILL_009065, partial [Bacillariaceae sp.]
MVAAFLKTTSAQSSVVDLVVNDPQLSILETLVVNTPGLAGTLNALDDITVFAPTNEAFLETLPVGLSQEQVAAVLQYHVVTTGAFAASDVSDGLTLPTALEGESLVFTVNVTGVFINEGMAQVVATDFEATNGIIHKVNGVLLPSFIAEEFLPSMPSMAPLPTPAPTTEGPGNIVEVAVGLDGFSTLVDLVVLAELDDVLASLPRATVLAPTDDAFAALDPSLVAALTSPPYKLHLQEILLYHSFETILRGPNLLNSRSVRSRGGVYITTLSTNQDRVQFKTPDGASLNINNGFADVVVADVAASNGVIHAIDQVLLPSFASKSVTTVIQEDVYDLRTLKTLLDQAALLGVLAGQGPFTVFAPIDEAFDGIVAPDDVDALTDILTYHVVPGMYPSFLIEDGLELTTVKGTNITFSVTEM